jgi:predicted MFS family arabinose efflux permease
MIGFLLLWLYQNLWLTYIAFIIWTFAEIIIVPSLNALAINSSAVNLHLTIFSINTVAMGVGEGLGNFFGAYFAGHCLLSGCWSDLFGILLIMSILFFVTGLLCSYKS